MQNSMLESIEDANLLYSLTSLTSSENLRKKYLDEACFLAVDVGLYAYYIETTFLTSGERKNPEQDCPKTAYFTDSPLQTAFQFGYKEAERATSFEEWLNACNHSEGNLKTAAGELIVYFYADENAPHWPPIPTGHIKIKEIAHIIEQTTLKEITELKVWKYQYADNVLAVADKLSEIESTPLLIYTEQFEIDLTDLPELTDGSGYDNEQAAEANYSILTQQDQELIRRTCFV